MNHLLISISRSHILQLGLYHWQNSNSAGSKTKLCRTPHEIFTNFEAWFATSTVKYHSAKQDSCQMIELFEKPTGRSLSCRNFWPIALNTFCRLIRIMPVYIPLSKPYKILSMRNDRNRSVGWLFLKWDWYL